MDIEKLLGNSGIALVQGHKTFLFAEFREAIIQKSSSFAQKKLPRIVAIKASNTIDYWVDFFSLIKNNHVVFPYIHHAPNYSWIQSIYDNGTVSLVNNLLAEPSELAVFAQKNRAGLILETSGTLGKKKVVLHDFELIYHKYNKLHRKFKTLLVFSPEHISGIETFISVMMPGGTVCLPETFDTASLCNIIYNSRVDLMACTPSFLRLVIISGKIELLKNVAILNIGGEMSDGALLETLKKALPNTKIYQAFGTTETSNIRTFPEDGSLYFKPGVEGVDYRIKGNLLWLKKTASLVCFLHGNTCVEDGWICTNDLVDKDTNGAIKILGREKELINVGGEKVDPAEVEAVIKQVRGVLSVKVTGASDLILGNKIIAEIYTEPGVLLDKRDILHFCKQHLATYKIPVKYMLREGLPLTSRLKIDHS